MILNSSDSFPLKEINKSYQKPASKTKLCPRLKYNKLCTFKLEFPTLLIDCPYSHSILEY